MAARSHDRLELPDSSTVGERAFAGKLYSEYGARLKRMIEHRVGPPLDDADILQEVILRAIRKWQEKGESRLPPYAFVYRLALDCIAEAWRAHHRRRELPLPDRSSMALAMGIALSTDGPSNRMRVEEEAARLIALIAQLNEVDRQVLQMRLLDELSSREAAEILDVKPNVVDARYARARKRLLKSYSAISSEFDSDDDAGKPT